MTIPSSVFQTFANLLPWWALIVFNACVGGEENKKTVKNLLETFYQKFNIIIDDSPARVRNVMTHFKNPKTKEVLRVRTFREVAVEILHTPILGFLNSWEHSNGYVLIHDAPGKAPIAKKHTAIERSKRKHENPPPTQEELNSRDFELDEPMPWTMHQIFASVAGRHKFLHALYKVLASAEFRAMIPLGKFVIFDGAIKEDNSWSVARITREGSEWLDDIPLVPEGDDAAMRWVHLLATSSASLGSNYLVTSNDGDVLLALLANYFRLKSAALQHITLTFHTKRTGKEFSNLLDDSAEEQGLGPNGEEPDAIVLALEEIKKNRTKTPGNFEQMVAGEGTSGRVDFFFDILKVARVIQAVHPKDPFAVESFIVAFLVACEKHDYVWHRFFCTYVGVEYILPAHVVWGSLYGPLVTNRKVKGPEDCGPARYEFDLRAMFDFILIIYYAKFYQAKQKLIAKENFERTQSNNFLENIGRPDLKNDLIVQPIGFRSGHEEHEMHRLDSQLLSKAKKAYASAYENNKTTLKAFKEEFDVVPVEAFGGKENHMMRRICIGVTQLAFMIQHMTNSPFGVDASGIEVDPESGRPYAAYDKNGYTCKPMIFYQDVLPGSVFHEKCSLSFRYPYFKGKGGVNIQPLSICDNKNEFEFLDADDVQSYPCAGSSSSTSSLSSQNRGTKRKSSNNGERATKRNLGIPLLKKQRKRRPSESLTSRKVEENDERLFEEIEDFLNE